MVLQVAADALPVERDIYAERLQPLAGADTRAMQYLRRSDRTRAEDDLARRVGFHDFRALPEAHADGASVLQDQAIGLDIGFQPQIGAGERGLEKSAGRGPASPAHLVDVEIADAFVVAGVEIRCAAYAQLRGGLGHRVEDLPRNPRRLDAPSAADAVVFARAEKVILERLEGRQHIVPAPAGQPELAPMVVVGCLSAHRDHCIDG